MKEESSNDMHKLRIGVVALLKPSQVYYKLYPLAMCEAVESIYIFRKREYSGSIPKLHSHVLPKLMTIKFFYWFITPLYLAYSFKKVKVDVLLSYHFLPHGIFSYIVAKLIGKPFVYSQIDLDVFKQMKSMFWAPIISLTLKDALMINVPGGKSKQVWEKKFSNKKVNILHSTVDPEYYIPSLSEKVFDLVYIGVLYPRKQVDLIIKAIALLKDAGENYKLSIVGDGSEMDSLLRLSQDLGLEDNIIFAGHKNDIYPELIKSKAFIMASRNEGLPCALMEAMSCELVCLAPDVADVTDAILDGKTGLIISNTDVNEIAQKISYVMNNYTGLDNVRKYARQHIINNHSFTSATAKWDKLLSEISL